MKVELSFRKDFRGDLLLEIDDRIVYKGLDGIERPVFSMELDVFEKIKTNYKFIDYCDHLRRLKTIPVNNLDSIFNPTVRIIDNDLDQNYEQ